MSCRQPLRSYPSSLFETTTDWFARATAALLDSLPCRRGCHHCCIGVFPVTILDQEKLQRGLALLPQEQRHAIQQKAGEQAERISSIFQGLADNRFLDEWPDQEIDRVVELFSDLPCPALQADGSCGVYQSRPLTCRSMGIPFEADGLVHGACSVQTFVPLIRLSASLRGEEEALARAEAMALEDTRKKINALGEEILLPFAFLPETSEEKETT